MYTSLVLFALAVPGADEGLTWVRDYQEARQQAASKSKPLAVFLAPGRAAAEKVARDGLSAEARRQLASNYIAVAIDTSTEQGRGLAERFEMPTGQGLVISDRTGRLQAFRHEGELSKADLDNCLRRYAEANRVVSTTETLTSTRASFYGPGAETIPGPMMQGGTMGYVPGPQGYVGSYPGYQGYPGYYSGGYWGGPGYYGDRGYYGGGRRGFMRRR